MVRITNPRIGHRVGGFYVSTNGRSTRVGHRLPGGFYGTVTAASGTPQRSRPSSWRDQPDPSPRAQAITALVLIGVLTLIGLISGWWLLDVIAVWWLGFLIMKGRANLRRAETERN
jgi:hypothetical protein